MGWIERAGKTTLFVILGLGLSSFTIPASAFTLDTSTQYYWGLDGLGDSEPALAEYLRFSHYGEGKLSFTGYGRVHQDFGTGNVRDNNAWGRLYYMYMDYSGETAGVRLGRHFVNYSSGSSVMDGLSVDLDKFFEKVGFSVSAGNDVVYALDSDHSTKDRMLAAVDIHLQNMGMHELSVSYARRYDATDLATEKIGLTASTMLGSFKPYAELRQDMLGMTPEETILGVEYYMTYTSALKLEYYQSYPVFDSTSIYSVFGVDSFTEYVLEYQRSIGAYHMTLGYRAQNFEDSETADVGRLGVTRRGEKLFLAAEVDIRNGYRGDQVGGELSGNYRLSDKTLAVFGVQHDQYKRSEGESSLQATRVWGGGDYKFAGDARFFGRVEMIESETYSASTRGRVGVDWTF